MAAYSIARLRIAPKPLKGRMLDAGTEGSCDFERPIGASGIDYHDFVSPAHAGYRPFDVLLIVNVMTQAEIFGTNSSFNNSQDTY